MPYIHTISGVFLYASSLLTSPTTAEIITINANQSMDIKRACANAFNTKTTTFHFGNSKIVIGHKNSTAKTLELGTYIREESALLRKILKNLRGQKPIKLTIRITDSLGGSFNYTEAFFKALQANPQHDIITLSSGKNASGSTIFSFSGEKRVVIQGSSFLLHSAGTQNAKSARKTLKDFSKSSDTYKFIERKNSDLREMYRALSSTKVLSGNCLKALIDPSYNIIITGKESVQFGLTDCLIGGQGTFTVRTNDTKNFREACGIKELTPTPKAIP